LTGVFFAAENRFNMGNVLKHKFPLIVIVDS